MESSQLLDCLEAGLGLVGIWSTRPKDCLYRLFFFHLNE